MSELRLKMYELCVWVREQARGRRADLREHNSEVERIICDQTAMHFKLWDQKGKAPRWLNRIVEGIVHDVVADSDETV